MPEGIAALADIALGGADAAAGAGAAAGGADLLGSLGIGSLASGALSGLSGFSSAFPSLSNVASNNAASSQDTQLSPLLAFSGGQPGGQGGGGIAGGYPSQPGAGDNSAIQTLASDIENQAPGGAASQPAPGDEGPSADTTGGNQTPNTGDPARPGLKQPPRPGQPVPGQPGPQPWGTPQPGVARQPPPGYLPTSLAPNAPGAQPSQQGQPGASPGPQGAGGGGQPRIPSAVPAQQGAGAVGNLGGAAGIPLPALVQALLRQYQGRPPPFGGQPGFGGGRYPYPGRFPQRFLGGRPQGRAPFSPQSQRAFVPREAMGGSYAPRGLGGERGLVPQGPNYMQRLYRGEYPPHESQMRQLNTPAGPVKVNPLAAGDFQGFTRDLQRHGFPFEKPWGSYNRRRMRWSNNWSSHAWGTAFDMNDSAGGMSPRMRQWMQQNPGLFQQLLRQWNMSQPLPGRDPNHIEWTGPNPQYHPPDTQTAGGHDPSAPLGSEANPLQNPSMRLIDPPISSAPAGDASGGNFKPLPPGTKPSDLSNEEPAKPLPPGTDIGDFEYPASDAGTA